MQRLLVGTRKGLIIYRQNGVWELESTSFHGIPVQLAVYDERRDTIWASLDHGHWGIKLAKSTDGGTTWDDVEIPKYPEDAERGDGEPATTRLIWSIAFGGADQPERIWMGTEPGGLFVSNDYGESFELVRGLWDHPSRKTGWFGGGRDHPAIHSILVDPRDSTRILIAISCAGVFESTDDGQTWTPRNTGLTADFLPDPNSEIGQDPHIVVWNENNPDMMWQQNHCGIYRSKDGGGTWSDVSTEDRKLAYFGFAVAVDEKDPEVAWVVPAVGDESRFAVDGAVHVARTEDGGESWTALRNGLPQENAWDLTFRHALDNRGDTLAFGTTTGNLFWTADRGDAWQTVSNFLPPVYSVRFANW